MLLTLLRGNLLFRFPAPNLNKVSSLSHQKYQINGFRRRGLCVLRHADWARGGDHQPSKEITSRGLWSSPNPRSLETRGTALVSYKAPDTETITEKYFEIAILMLRLIVIVVFLSSFVMAYNEKSELELWLFRIVFWRLVETVLGVFCGKSF